MGKSSSSDPKSQDASAWKFFVAIGILASLLIGYYAFGSWQQTKMHEQNRYNGYDFAQSAEGFWVTRIEAGNQPYDIPFYFHPREVEDVLVYPNVTVPLLNPKPQQLYISIDPDAGATPVVAAVEIARITGHKYDLLNIPTASALSRPADTGLDVPIISCKNASQLPQGISVIQFVEDPSVNAIIRDGACVLLFYKDANESVRVADRYAYLLLGIMR